MEKKETLEPVTSKSIDTSTPCVVLCPGFHGHGAARSLGRLGVPVYGVHSDPNSPTASSRFWRKNYFWDISATSNQDSLDMFLQLGQKIGSRPILIPSDDHACLFVDENAEALSRVYQFPRQPVGLTQALSNKKTLYALCKKESILTAETSFPQNRNDVLDYLKNCEFPVMLKGIDTVALQKRVGVRMAIVDDAETLLKKYDEMENPDHPGLMLQEFIPGGRGNIWMFDGYFNNQSDCLFGITARKIRQYPAYTGMTSLGVCESNPELFRMITDFMKAVGYRGILDIGYKYNPQNGKYYLLDPNPRLGASFRLFVDTVGMDVVKALYLDLTGQPIKIGEIKEGRKWLVEPFDIISSYRYWRDGNLKPGEWLRSFSGVEEAQWFSLDDMRPFWKVWQRSIQVLFGSKNGLH